MFLFESVLPFAIKPGSVLFIAAKVLYIILVGLGPRVDKIKRKAKDLLIAKIR